MNYFAAFKQIIARHSFYSFSFTLGGNIFGFITYYLMSPLNLILLLVPLPHLAAAITIITSLKIGLLGLTMVLFFARQPNKNLNSENAAWVKLIFSTLYALSSFFIGFSMNIIWFDAIIMLPLVLLAVDHLLATGKISWLIITLSITIVLNYYIAFMVGFFSFVWLLYRLQGRIKQPIWPALKHFILAVVATVAVTTVIWLPTLNSLHNIKRSSVANLLMIGKGYSLSHGFGRSFLAGTYSSNFDRAVNGAPLIYCSSLIFVLILAYFCARAISRRAKISAAIVLAFLVFSTWFTPLNTLWHGGTPPQGFYNRFAFVIVFFMLYLAYVGLSQMAAGLDKKRFIGISGLIFIVIFVYHFKYPYFLSLKAAMLNLMLLVFNVVLIMLWPQKDALRRQQLTSGLIYLLLLVAVGEVAFNDRHIEANNYTAPSTTDFSTFTDQVAAALDQLPNLTLRNLRTEMAFSRSDNDPLLFNYAGMSHYSSSESKQTIRLMAKLGYLQDQRWTNYSNGSTAFMDRYFGISNVVEDPLHSLDALIRNNGYMGHGQPTTYGGSYQTHKKIAGSHLSVAHNAGSLPLLFPSKFDNTKQNILTSKTTPFVNQNILAKGLFKRPVLRLVKAVPLQKIGLRQTYQITPTTNGELYLYLNATGFSNNLHYAPVTISRGDRKSVLTDFNFGENGILDLGYGRARQPVKFTLDRAPQNNLLINHPSVASLEPNAKLTSQLQQVRHHVSQQHIAGSTVTAKITGKKRQTVIMTVPYDTGWHATVNGHEVSVKRAYGELTKIQLANNGANKIRLHFVPRGLKAGLIVSLMTLLGLFSFYFRRVFIDLGRKSNE
ncbi:YfhO family protein [Loigolactobacillus backii]|uniref:YfhO family protein n=1 Tax=Loigolactobacillus backii TaxID=375175 RepID=UPI0022FD4523|nr:YfhO family protein [Loigolactobacillus backii]MDA5388920.1 YfhO family protein [Loigolactobacillus backii]MDA5390650.1 YfhO family protein [Loigolactobacillus backii]